MESIESLIHNLAMAAWDAGCESGVVWCPDADMSKRGVVPMTQEEGLRDSREHFAAHGGGAEASEFDSALRAIRAALNATQSDGMPKDREELQELLNGAYNKGRDDIHALYQSGIPMTLLRSELERTREELERVRSALTNLVNGAGPRGHHLGCECEGVGYDGLTCRDRIRGARAALERKEGV